jgi:hypothetical protein
LVDFRVLDEGNKLILEVEDILTRTRHPEPISFEKQIQSDTVRSHTFQK